MTTTEPESKVAVQLYVRPSTATDVLLAIERFAERVYGDRATNAEALDAYNALADVVLPLRGMRDHLEVGTAAPAPPRPRPTLPNPGVTSNGMVHCNEPFEVGGQTVAHCGRWVRPSRSRWRRQRPATHRGAHRLEWWS